ncbi:AAA family ATPase [Sporosarcina sp. FA9]|uniref:AAA family ATPase n=1 Tax=Sporosarcina sp. FA9 TaxID=3413030 RepID=UPI003F65AE95
MRIGIKNIGSIDCANLKINSIAIIAGENNTGKSTIGKSVYALFQGTKNVEEGNLNEQYLSLLRELRRLKSFFEFKSGDFDENFFISFFNDVEESLEERDLAKVMELFKLLKEDNQVNYENEEMKKSAFYEIDRFLRVLNIDVTSLNYKTSYLERVFKDEFSNSINSLYNKQLPSEITATWEKSSHNKIVFNDNILNKDETHIEHFKNLGAIYIDNPFVLDDVSPSRFYRFNSFQFTRNSLDHSTQLRNLLPTLLKEVTLFDEFVNMGRFDDILSEVIKGTIKFDGKGIQFEENKTGSAYPVNNLATGIKSFSLIKSLIESGELSRNDILILDEPEVHLHPSWQLKYAELIVLLSLELNIKILVTSHSPYFVEAIELYSKKHKINKLVNYYQTVRNPNGNTLKDVTNDLPLLHADFANPFIHLEKLRDEYDDLD